MKSVCAQQLESQRNSNIFLDGSPSMPTSQPSALPSMKPSTQPSSEPSMKPSSQPSSEPSNQPSATPTSPSSQPSSSPSVKPTAKPTGPTEAPTYSQSPTFAPSYDTNPTFAPSHSFAPTSRITADPTSIPTARPQLSQAPTYAFERISVSGTVGFFPDTAEMCRPTQLVISITFGDTLPALSRFKVTTPGFTSGRCYVRENGWNISSLSLFTLSSIFDASFVEGQHANNFLDSYIEFTTNADISGAYTIPIDASNNLRRSCDTNRTWDVEVKYYPFDGQGKMGTLSVTESFPKICYQYFSSMVLSNPHQQMMTGINLTFDLPFEVTENTVITVLLPGFTNKRGIYTINPLTGGTDENVIGLGQDKALCELTHSTNISWTGQWYEGTNYSHSYLTLTSVGKYRYRDRFWINIDKTCNHLVSIFGAEKSSSQFKSKLQSTNYEIYWTEFSYVNPIGIGCSEQLNSCSNNGICNFTDNTCTCFDGFGSEQDKLKTPSNGNNIEFNADCSSRSCPTGVSWATLARSQGAVLNSAYKRTAYHWREEECSNHGVCNRKTGECHCSVGFTGSACQRMVCPGDPVCSGRGMCTSIKRLARKYEALPLNSQSGSTGIARGGPIAVDGGWYATVVEYMSILNYTNSSLKQWDADLGHVCICDSSWSVGLGSNETQQSEYFGNACQYRRCPTGNNPATRTSDTDCEGRALTGGTETGKTGNLCHIDCSNRGDCNYDTGVCKCYEGWTGVNCATNIAEKMTSNLNYDKKKTRSDNDW